MFGFSDADRVTSVKRAWWESDTPELFIMTVMIERLSCILTFLIQETEVEFEQIH